MMLSNVCLSDIRRVHPVSGRRAAGRLDGAYWLIWPGPAQPALLEAAAAGFHCRPGHIVVASRL